MLVILAVPARFHPLPEATFRFKTATRSETKPRMTNSHPGPPSPPGGIPGYQTHFWPTKGFPRMTQVYGVARSVQRHSIDPYPSPPLHSSNSPRLLPMLSENTNNPIGLTFGADHH